MNVAQCFSLETGHARADAPAAPIALETVTPEVVLGGVAVRRHRFIQDDRNVLLNRTNKKLGPKTASVICFLRSAKREVTRREMIHACKVNDNQLQKSLMALERRGEIEVIKEVGQRMKYRAI